jgi:hypothetical protein
MRLVVASTYVHLIADNCNSFILTLDMNIINVVNNFQAALEAPRVLNLNSSKYFSGPYGVAL